MNELINTQILSQFDTQPIDQSIPQKTLDPNIWGRLLPINTSFPQIDLKKDATLFGRRPDCDIRLDTIKNSHCDVNTSAYSNLHFTINREFTGKSGQYALLKDSSSNGTFINGEKVGKGRVQALKNNSEISLCLNENKAYIFIDLSSNDDKNYPLEIRKKYTVTKQLGKGAYGDVFLAFDKVNCNKFAIKVISKKNFTNNTHIASTSQKIKTEIDILTKAEHPCIVGVHEVVELLESVYIVLDLVEGGELFDKVVSLGQYDESSSKLLFYQMVLAIKYLHDQGISHRDLKPENILLASDKNRTLIKVTDFGMSKFFDSTVMMQTFCGTPNYLAPEVLITRGTGKYTNKVDNWSLGVILYIMLSGIPPFNDENLDRQIIQGKYDFTDESWSKVSNQAKNVIKKLMTVNPEKRASLEDILADPWIQNDFDMIAEAQNLMYPDPLLKIPLKNDKNEEVNNKKRILERSNSSKSSDQSQVQNYKKRLRRLRITDLE